MEIDSSISFYHLTKRLKTQVTFQHLRHHLKIKVQYLSPNHSLRGPKILEVLPNFTDLYSPLQGLSALMESLCQLF